jgi:hypothetical protein
MSGLQMKPGRPEEKAAKTLVAADAAVTERKAAATKPTVNRLTIKFLKRLSQK